MSEGLSPNNDQSELIEQWGSDILENWTERWGEQASRGMFRTALISICHVREARARAEASHTQIPIEHLSKQM